MGTNILQTSWLATWPNFQILYAMLVAILKLGNNHSSSFRVT